MVVHVPVARQTRPRSWHDAPLAVQCEKGHLCRSQAALSHSLPQVFSHQVVQMERVSFKHDQCALAQQS
eukprot:scaffold23787_cov73-Phaeocystis_antarctica.AAC.3